MFRNSFNSVDLDEVSSVPVIHPDQLGGGRHHHLLLLLQRRVMHRLFSRP